MNEKELLDEIHMEVHVMRRIPNYKPSPSEVKIAKMIREHFKSKCKECEIIIGNASNPSNTKSKFWEVVLGT